MSTFAYNNHREGLSMDKKIRLVTVTSKRQFTIPVDFFKELNMSPGKVRCILENGRIIIEPINTSSFWDFSADILQELVSEGLNGEELVKEFKQRKNIVKEAFLNMVNEAKEDIEKGIGRDAEEVFNEILSDESSREL